MSETLAACRQNVRLMLDDLKLGDVAIGSLRLDDIIYRESMLIAGQLYGGVTVSAGAISVSAGTDDYSLGASSQHNSLADPIWDATGQPLVKVTMDDMDVLRRGASVPTGTPTYYALWEDDSTNVMTIRLAPRPVASGTLTLRRSVLPSAFTSDSSTIGMSDLALRGLEWRCAASAVASVGDDALAKLGIKPQIVGYWNGKADDALKAEQARLGLAKRQATVVRRNA